MTLNEILAEINANPLTVYVKQNWKGEHLWINVGHWINQALNIVQDEEIEIVIVDKGQPTEKAFYKQIKPAHLMQTPFKTEVETLIAGYQASHPTLEAYTIDSVDEGKQWAFAVAYVYDSTLQKVVAKPYLIFKKAGVLTIREIDRTK